MHQHLPNARTARAQTPSRQQPTARAARLLLASGALLVPLHSAWGQSAGVAGALPPVTVKEGVDKGYAATRSSTATKTDTPLIDTPQSIVVITQDQVRDQGSKSMAEALRYVPGVGFAQGEGNRETPILRGIATTSDFYVDGVRDDVQYFRDLYNIERVEVFRGPNAMIFGRGATGGLINRVAKQANWSTLRAGSVSLGSNGHKRASVDLNQPVNEDLALRLNAMHENSDSYRDGVSLRRTGINPTLSWKAGGRTLVTAGYEHFRDDRIADRGVPSYRGRPFDSDPSVFFGNAAASPTWTRLNAFNLMLEHEFGNGLQVRNRTRVAKQDKFYQNVYPGAINPAGTQVSISAYHSRTDRDSQFNQTDFTYSLRTGALQHKLLAGMELGRQTFSNFRETGYFPGNVSSVNVPVGDPMSAAPVAWRNAGNDADNKGTAKVAGFYLQDQITFSPQWQLVGGLRVDRFSMDYTNNRNNERLDPSDSLVSPRLGVIYKPRPDMSLYANYSIAHQPRAGEQLSSLTASTASLSPEKFKNYEVGAKWDLRANLALTAALFRLERDNVLVLDPADPSTSILGKGQRTEGVELGLGGHILPAWSITGGYAYTRAKFVADTSATLRAGGAVAQVPKHSFSLWNRYDFTPAWGAALGVIYRAKSFATNEQIATTASPMPNVVLPGYTRFDAAVYYTVSKNMNLQLNVENLFDRSYWANAHNNNNITPGAPRAFRVALNAAF